MTVAGYEDLFKRTLGMRHDSHPATALPCDVADFQDGSSGRTNQELRTGLSAKYLPISS
jgi:hypothetical protein